MRYLKNFLLATKEIFWVNIIQYILLVISAIIFKFNSERVVIYGTLILMLFEILYILYIGRRKKYKNTISKRYFPYILFGISINIIFNMILFKTQNIDNSILNIPTVLIIISSGIIGPIFEEIIFRYNYINKLKVFNSKFWCIIISSTLFAICHTNINSILYALILGIINSYLYIKKKDIIIPILIHISGNIIAIFLYEFNLYILILGIILLIISIINIHLTHFNKS